MRAVRLVKQNCLRKILLIRCAAAPPAIARETSLTGARHEGSGIDDRPTHFQPPGVVIWNFRYGKKIIDEIP
jgi:hypothetical protein